MNVQGMQGISWLRYMSMPLRQMISVISKVLKDDS